MHLNACVFVGKIKNRGILFVQSNRKISAWTTTRNGGREDGVHNCKQTPFTRLIRRGRISDTCNYFRAGIFVDSPDISNFRSAAEGRGGRNSFSNRSGGDGGQQQQMQQPPQPPQQPAPASQETEQNDTVRRQQSVAGEDIKIVIHDVDFDPNIMGKSFSPSFRGDGSDTSKKSTWCFPLHLFQCRSYKTALHIAKKNVFD